MNKSRKKNDNMLEIEEVAPPGVPIRSSENDHQLTP